MNYQVIAKEGMMWRIWASARTEDEAKKLVEGDMMLLKEKSKKEKGEIVKFYRLFGLNLLTGRMKLIFSVKGIWEDGQLKPSNYVDDNVGKEI